VGGEKSQGEAAPVLAGKQAHWTSTAKRASKATRGKGIHVKDTGKGWVRTRLNRAKVPSRPERGGEGAASIGRLGGDKAGAACIERTLRWGTVQVWPGQARPT